MNRTFFDSTVDVSVRLTGDAIVVSRSDAGVVAQSLWIEVTVRFVPFKQLICRSGFV